MDIKDIPKRLEVAPCIQFIRCTETCGLLSFSSALYEYFNKLIVSQWMNNTNEYTMAMAETKGHQSKRSGVMNYLKTLVMKI